MKKQPGVVICFRRSMLHSTHTCSDWRATHQRKFGFVKVPERTWFSIACVASFLAYTICVQTRQIGV